MTGLGVNCQNVCQWWCRKTSFMVTDEMGTIWECKTFLFANNPTSMNIILYNQALAKEMGSTVRISSSDKLRQKQKKVEVRTLA